MSTFVTLMLMAFCVLIFGKIKSESKSCEVLHTKLITLYIIVYCLYITVFTNISVEYYMITSVTLVVVVLYYMIMSRVWWVYLTLSPPLLLKLYEILLVVDYKYLPIFESSLNYILNSDYYLISTTLFLFLLEHSDCKINKFGIIHDINNFRTLVLLIIFTLLFIQLHI